jgi:hypothetical protein
MASLSAAFDFSACCLSNDQFTGDYHLRLTQVVEKTALGSYEEATAAFLKWMEGVEQLLAAEKFVADEQDVMEHQLSQHTV